MDLNRWGLGRGRRGGRAAGSRTAVKERVIAAPPACVWAVVSDVTRAPEWWPRAKRGEVLSGVEGGRRQRLVMDWGRREGVVEQEVVEWDPPHRYSWRVCSEAAGGRVLAPLADTRIAVEILGQGPPSLVRITATYEPAGPRGWIAVRQVVRLARATFAGALRNLDALTGR